MFTAEYKANAVGALGPVVNWKYIGAYSDSDQVDASLYHLGARYYNPDTGRFTEPDPSGQDANPYAYAAGDPVDLADRTGLNPIDDIPWSPGGWSGEVPNSDFGASKSQREEVDFEKDSDEDMFGSVFEHIRDDPDRDRPTHAQIRAAVRHAVPNCKDRGRVFHDWKGVRVITNYEQPWQSAAFYRGKR